MKTVLTLFVAVSALASSPASAACFATEAFIRVALQNYGEIPVWTGKSDGGLTVTMVLNPETQTWGIVQGDDKKVCLIITGVGVAPVVLGEPV